jgi:hypothetical protein
VIGDAKQARRAIDATAEAAGAVLAIHNSLELCVQRRQRAGADPDVKDRRVLHALASACSNSSARPCLIHAGQPSLRRADANSAFNRSGIACHCQCLGAARCLPGHRAARRT